MSVVILSDSGHPDRFTHTDVDGDKLLITTAFVPGHGSGVYFRTSPNGSSVLLADIPALIAQLQVIADAAKADAEADGSAV